MNKWPDPNPSHDPIPLTEDHLRAILEVQGSFPNKYRAICWRYLLALPNDKQTFKETTGGITQPVASLMELYPIKDSRLQRRLRTVLTSIDRQANSIRSFLPTWLPALAFPFIQVFGPDLCASVEAVLTLLCNWFPLDVLPPVQIIAELDTIISCVLPSSHRSTERYEGGNTSTVTGYTAWGVLQTAGASAVDDWPMLMDHVLMEPIQFMYIVAVTIQDMLCHSRAARPLLPTTDVIRKAKALRRRYVEEYEGLMTPFIPLSSVSLERMLPTQTRYPGLPTPTTPSGTPSRIDERRVIDEGEIE